MLKIGLTGGIGSGKSTVARVFEQLGIPVYYADQAAKDLMNDNAELKEQVISAFGYQSYKQGKLDRAYLGNLVFADEEKLNLLNSIVHPATLADGEQWMNRQTTPYAIKEAAIIFEAGLQSYFDFIIGVSAPESIRIERVMQRDKTTQENILQRIDQQMDEKEKMARCDFVIQNDGLLAILPQVMAIHEELLKRTI